jgi:hypothetical protein
MTAQLDMFGDAPASAPPPRPAQPLPVTEPLFPTPPTIAWARKLTEAGDAGRHVECLVSRQWSRVVAESLQRGAEGRTLLYADGTMHEIAADPGATGRVIFLDPPAAIALHRKHPLINLMSGHGAARFRLARPGEAAPIELELPPGLAEAALQSQPE